MIGNDGFSQRIRDASLQSKIPSMSMKHYTKEGDFHTLEWTDQHGAAKCLQFCKKDIRKYLAAVFLAK